MLPWFKFQICSEREMASSGSMKGFYRQRKTGGISKSNKPSKPSSLSSSSSNKLRSPANSATLGSHTPQPPALISHGTPDIEDDYDQHEEMLRQFDLNMAYGPCLGMTRLARWERACRLNLNPPKEIESFLKATKVQSECLWDGRV